MEDAMRKEKYNYLREQYPEYVSENQLYKICHIAKRSAKYLLDNGIIPCENSGKKTRKYRIALNDIIAYLEKRDKTLNSMIPRGCVNSCCKAPRSPRISPSAILSSESESVIRSYFEYIYADYPDVVGTYDVSEMTGLNQNTVLRLLKNKEIQSLTVGTKYKIPKQFVLAFVVSPRFINMKSNSADFNKIIGGFEIWKTAKL
jgi:excisionase family DNA binding protein